MISHCTQRTLSCGGPKYHQSISFFHRPSPPQISTGIRAAQRSRHRVSEVVYLTIESPGRRGGKRDTTSKVTRLLISLKISRLKAGHYVAALTSPTYIMSSQQRFRIRTARWSITAIQRSPRTPELVHASGVRRSICSGASSECR